MNTDPNRPTPGGGDEQPITIGAGLRPVEERLRRSLASQAELVSPTDDAVVPALSSALLLPVSGVTVIRLSVPVPSPNDELARSLPPAHPSASKVSPMLQRK